MTLRQTLLEKIKQAKLEETKNSELVEQELKHAEEVIAEREAQLEKIKANEVEHTTNTGFGEELVKDGQLNEVIDLAFQYSTLLPYLPGYHGTNLSMIEKLPVTGEIGLFRGNSEPKNKADYRGPIGLTTLLPTGEVEIRQGMFRHDILISYRLLNYSIIDLYDKYMTQIGQSQAKTIDAYIINADGSLTDNINSVGTTFTEGDRENYYFLQGGSEVAGLRKHGIANPYEVGALTEDDYLDMTDKLGNFGNLTDDILIVQQRRTQNFLNKLPIFKEANLSGTITTIRGKAVTSIWGMDIFINQYIPLLAQADGKVSATAEDNIAGQILMFYTPAVQYGFGQPLKVDVAIEPGKGIWLVPYFEFGMTIVDTEAGTDHTTTLGVNVTYGA